MMIAKVITNIVRYVPVIAFLDTHRLHARYCQDGEIDRGDAGHYICSETVEEGRTAAVARQQQAPPTSSSSKLCEGRFVLEEDVDNEEVQQEERCRPWR